MSRENRTNSKRPVKLFLVPYRINSAYVACLGTAQLSKFFRFLARIFSRLLDPRTIATGTDVGYDLWSNKARLVMQ
jgi:hypothetical protein